MTSQPQVKGKASWEATPIQKEALMSVAFEILFGGSRGGGKTDAGQAWMLYDVTNPRFRGLVIRRNASDLSDWISRAKAMYRPMRPVFTVNPAQIVFPSGGTIVLGHLKDENAYEKYQGHEYHRILIEELTQIPTEELYLRLISSARSTVPGLSPQVFATTNPGGPGHKWVKKRWGIEGTPTKEIYRIDETTLRDRTFIPARVDDNPHLMKNDPHYVKFLDGLPDGLRQAWRLGSWSDVEIKGAIYGEFLTQARLQGRINKDGPQYNPLLPVFTVWDIGVADNTAIGFFQRVTQDANGYPLDVPKLNLIDFYESNAKGLQHYVKVLQAKAYIYGIHFAPHDIAVKEWGSGLTRLETAKTLGIEFDVLRKTDIGDAIENAQNNFHKLHINETTCSDWMDAIRQHRREWDEKMLRFKDKPLHDWTSHAADVLKYAFLAEEMMINPAEAYDFVEPEYKPLFPSINL